MSKNQKSKKSNLAGYRLHNARLMFSGGNSIRTIKLPLVPYGVKGRGKKEKRQDAIKRIHAESRSDKLFKAVTESVRSDYRSMYGPLNINDYQRDKDMYSLKDFWIDSLKAGVIFAESPSKVEKIIKDTQYKKQLEDSAKGQELLSLIDDFDKFDKTLLVQAIRWGSIKNKDSKKEEIRLLFKDSKKAQNEAENLFQALSKCKEREQKKVWLDRYDLKVIFHSQYPYPFYITPNIYFKKDADISDLLDSYLKYAVSKEDILIKFKAKPVDNKAEDSSNRDTILHYIVGCFGEYNGFSNYFNFNHTKLASDVNPIFESIKSYSTEWNGKEDDLRERLEYLSGQAKKLPKTTIVKDWNRYNHDIGGSIAGWLSNSFRQDEIIYKLLYGDPNNKKYDKVQGKDVIDPINGHIHEIRGPNLTHNSNFKSVRQMLEESLSEIQQSLKSTTDEREKHKFQQDKDNLESLLDITKQLSDSLDEQKKKINQDQPKIDSNFLFSYRLLLADFGERFNKFYQDKDGTTGLDKEEIKASKKKSVNEEYPKLFKALPKIPKFLGEVKIGNKNEEGLYDKYEKSYDILKKGVDFLHNVQINYQHPINKYQNDQLEEKAIRIKKALDALLRLYRSTDSATGKPVAITKKPRRGLYRSTGSTTGKQYIESLVKQYCKDPKQIDNLKRLDHFYRSEYTRETRGDKIDLKEDNELLVHNVKGLIKRLDAFKWKLDNFKSHQWNEKVQEWSIGVGIEKIKIGLATDFYEVESSFDDEQYDIYFKQLPFIRDRYEVLKNDNGEKIKRNQAQNSLIQQGILSEMSGLVAQMSKQEIIARYVVQPTDAEKEYPVVMRDGQYYIDLGKLTKEKDSTEKKMYNISKDKNLLKEKHFIKAHQNNLLSIRSSKYQTQFLNNSLSKKWKDMKPKLSSYSFIVEDTISVEWKKQGDAYRPIMDTIKETRLFVSIPFQLNPDGKVEIENKFLGIDIGEFGVAYYLLDSEDLSKKSKQQGFFFQPDMRKIRYEIRENKKRQKAGTFTGVNTKN